MDDASSLLLELKPILEEAGKLAQELRPSITRTLKPDGTIVTEADKRVEELLRKRLPALLPKATIFGEEFGSEPEGEDGLWCLDPVDGTSNFSFGSPIWGVSVGLVRGPKALLGGLYLPDLGEMYLGGPGHGATLNGKAIPQMQPGPIRNEELVSYPDRLLRRHVKERLPGKMRHSGAFIVDAAFTCLGRYRGLIGIREKLYDIAASIAIAEQVGADVRMADGSALNIETLKTEGSKLEEAWVIFPPDSGFTLHA